MMELPKHPLERSMKCPICGVDFKSIPVRRGASPEDHSHILEQHVCPKGHVYVTEINGTEMLSEY